MFCRPLYLFSAPLIALMWISIMVLWVKSGKAGRLTRGFSAAGQLALTNYLMQSILGTLFFYGYGLGWYGYLERYQQFLFCLHNLDYTINVFCDLAVLFSVWSLRVALAFVDLSEVSAFKTSMYVRWKLLNCVNSKI